MLFDKISNGSPYNKCHFIEILFFVYENEPSATFNLKNFLLVLAEYIYSGKICYCENKQDKNTHNIKSIRQSSAQNILSGKSRLTIEVPRVALENIKLPDMREIYVNQWYINIFINILISFINKGSYILTGV